MVLAPLDFAVSVVSDPACLLAELTRHRRMASSQDAVIFLFFAGAASGNEAASWLRPARELPTDDELTALAITSTETK